MRIDRVEGFVKRSGILTAAAQPAVRIRRRFRRYRLVAAREVLDNLERLLARDPIVKLHDFRGEFAMGSRSDVFRSIIETGSYEPRLAEACRLHVDVHRDAIDIGANVGFYTVLFARMLLDRTVLSIEPTEEALVRLKHNIELNGVQERVVLFPGVASNQKGDARIKTIPGREEYSSLGAMVHPNVLGSAYEVATVPSDTVDNLVREHDLVPGFIKLDVEGMEHVVLDGMREVLKSIRPAMLIEVLDPLLRQNGSSSEEVIGLLRSYGYEVKNPLDPQSPVGKGTSGELLCLPIR